MKYRTFLTCIITILFSSALLAQFTPEQRIEDSVIGWWDNLKFDKKLTAENNPDRKRKIDHLDKLVEWMKKSYTPVAGLGTYTRFINTNNYGVQFAVWNVSFNKEWLDNKGKFRPIPEELTKFGVYINSITGSFPIGFINKPGQYVFTWQPDGYSPNEQAARNRNQLDQGIHANANKFITHVNEVVTVYLTPGNKLPFIPVKLGEYLDMAEASLERQLENERKDVEAKWPGNLKAQQDAFAYRKNTVEKHRVNIQQLRVRHKNRLNEPAVTREMQPTMYSFQLDPDPFTITAQDNRLKSYFPIYKISPEVLEKCKTSEPQWIAIWVPFETKENGNQLWEMYQSVTENFNYEYVYNHFFSPEKNKGISYVASNKEELAARLDNYRNKGNQGMPASLQNLPEGLYFKDDFSGNAEGSKPTGWYFSSYGKHSTISTHKKYPGKWLKLGYNSDVTPAFLKKPIPEQFTLEFDLVTDTFSTRTGGAVKLHLSSYPLLEDGREKSGSPGYSLDLIIQAGNEADLTNNNFRGEIRMELHSQPAIYKENYAEGLYFKTATRLLTNKKTKTHIKLDVRNCNISLFMNDQAVATLADFKMSYGKECPGCKLPSGTRFNTLNFRNITNDAENTGLFISNVRISL